MEKYVGYLIILFGIGIIAIGTQNDESWKAYLGGFLGLFVMIGGLVMIHNYEINKEIDKDYNALRKDYKELRDHADKLDKVIEIMSDSDLSKMKIKHKDNEEIVDIIDNILEERNKLNF